MTLHGELEARLRDGLVPSEIGPSIDLGATENLMSEAADVIADMRRQIGALQEALTPSGGTKGEYIGEFNVPYPIQDEDGEERTLRINVPWTTIKEIMAAIRARAAAPPAAIEE